MLDRSRPRRALVPARTPHQQRGRPDRGQRSLRRWAVLTLAVSAIGLVAWLPDTGAQNRSGFPPIPANQPVDGRAGWFVTGQTPDSRPVKSFFPANYRETIGRPEGWLRRDHRGTDDFLALTAEATDAMVDKLDGHALDLAAVVAPKLAAMDERIGRALANFDQRPPRPTPGDRGSRMAGSAPAGGSLPAGGGGRRDDRAPPGSYIPEANRFYDRGHLWADRLRGTRIRAGFVPSYRVRRQGAATR